MFPFFSRAHFKARSASRDTETDQARAVSILRSIEGALEAAEAEHAGLTSRINDVLEQIPLNPGRIRRE